MIILHKHLFIRNITFRITVSLIFAKKAIPRVRSYSSFEKNYCSLITPFSSKRNRGTFLCRSLRIFLPLRFYPGPDKLPKILLMGHKNKMKLLTINILLSPYKLAFVCIIYQLLIRESFTFCDNFISYLAEFLVSEPDVIIPNPDTPVVVVEYPEPIKSIAELLLSDPLSDPLQTAHQTTPVLTEALHPPATSSIPNLGDTHFYTDQQIYNLTSELQIQVKHDIAEKRKQMVVTLWHLRETLNTSIQNTIINLSPFFPKNDIELHDDNHHFNRLIHHIFKMAETEKSALDRKISQDLATLIYAHGLSKVDDTINPVDLLKSSVKFESFKDRLLDLYV